MKIKTIVLVGAAAAAWNCMAGLEAGFKAPPNSAKPHTWYHMMNGNVTKEGITRDFEELAKAGIGGVQMFDAGCDIPPGGLDFNSPEWFEMFRHAAQEARRLGLEICIPNCSGWSSSGGPWNMPSNAMKRVTLSETRVTGGARFTGKLPRETKDNGFYADIGVFAFPTPPADLTAFTGVTVTREGASFRAESAAPFEVSGFSCRVTFPWAWSLTADVTVEVSRDGKTFETLETFKDVLACSGGSDMSLRFHGFARKETVRALRVTYTSHTKLTVQEARPEARLRISQIKAKTFDTRLDVKTDTYAATAEQAVAKDAVLDLTANMAADGTLDWDAPAGAWTVLRIGYLCNGRCNHPASDHGKGLEVDKLSAEAMDYHFEQYVARLCRTLGPYAGDVASGFNNILVDSYEVGSQNWTQKMEPEFLKRRGYSMRPWMPAFAGYVVGSVAETERFLEDFRRTVADLFAENYAGALTAKCHQYGLKCSIEPYGNCPADNLQYGQYCDIPMGEFWSHAGDPYGLGCGNAKFVSYVAHVWGKKYVGTESFTAQPGPGSGRWMTTPFSIKAQGDSAFANGVNRIIYHRFTHQPWADDRYLPGMTMGRWGMHLDRTQTWWDCAKDWFTYQARCQHLLQEGTFCADVLFFAGEQAPNQGGNTDGAAGSREFYKLPEGYDRDICPTDALHALKVEDGCVVVPGGVRYRVLAIPPMAAASPDVLATVTRLRDAGAVIAWPEKPVRAPGLKWGPDADARVRAAADALWAKGVHARSAAALEALKVQPDVTVVSVGEKDRKVEWLHRRSAEADWYFVATPNRLETTAEISFRQTGRVPELWDAETGVCAPADVWREEGCRTVVTVPFSVCGSKFVVFRRPSAGVAHRTRFDVTATPRADPPVPDAAQHTLVIRNARYGAEGEKVRKNCYEVSRLLTPGARVTVGNSTLGGDPALNIPKKLEVVYTLDGVTKTNVTAEHQPYTLPKGAQVKSAWYGDVKPGWKPQPDRMVDVTAQVAARVKDGRVSVLVCNGLAGKDPAFLTVKHLFVEYEYDGVVKRERVLENTHFELPKGRAGAKAPPAVEWRGGKAYAFQPVTVAGRTVTPPLPVPVAGAWDVWFPNGFLPNKLAKGSEEKVTLPGLVSWSDHAHTGVRYFSGTARYEKRIAAAEVAATVENGDLAAWLARGGRVALDLGSVKDFAEVTVNGRTYPVLWKPPFRVDITDAVRAGAPLDVSVKVTNLWANRLIGDDIEHADDCTWRGGKQGGVKEIGIKEIPEWVKKGEKSPTGRCTFTTWKHWDKEDELLPSGLIGPVYLRFAAPAGE